MQSYHKETSRNYSTLLVPEKVSCTKGRCKHFGEKHHIEPEVHCGDPRQIMTRDNLHVFVTCCEMEEKWLGNLFCDEEKRRIFHSAFHIFFCVLKDNGHAFNEKAGRRLHMCAAMASIETAARFEDSQFTLSSASNLKRYPYFKSARRLAAFHVDFEVATGDYTGDTTSRENKVLVFEEKWNRGHF